MVLPTFEHLDSAKQARVRAALLKEFSAHPLAEAQVARIVTDAGIARGAFYKYFSDLTDAYLYVFGQAMAAIHQGMPQRPTKGNTAAYIEALQQFVDHTQNSEYQALIHQHFCYNEGVLGSRPSSMGKGPDGAEAWAIEVLYHQTVRDIVLDPASADARIAQLEAALNVPTKGAK